jgi:hypothetical protein
LCAALAATWFIVLTQPGVVEPVWMEGSWAFLKLSAVVVATRMFVRAFHGCNAS